MPTPRFFSALENLQTSSWSCEYVSVRVSPGSPFPDDRWSVPVAGLNVGVQAVVRNVRLAAGVPLDIAAALLADGVKGREPVQLLAADVAPKFVGIGFGRVIKFLVVIHRADSGVGAEFRWRRKESFLKHHAVDLSVFLYLP